MSEVKRTVAWYCEPCTLHDRATVRLSDEVPTLPCPHYGDGPTDCKRIGWKMRSWRCLGCERIGRTTIQYAPQRPENRCPVFPKLRTHQWVETEESQWVTSQRKYEFDIEEAS